MYKKLLFTCVIGILACSTGQSQGKYLETIKITDSIYVFKPKIDWVHGNGIAIIGTDGVFFIDTYLQPNYAEEAIKRLKAVTKLPVKFVLNTHFHNDHVMGNYEFKKAFPGCQIIVHDSTYPKMITNIKRAIDNEMANNDAEVATVEKEIKNGVTRNGTPIVSDRMKAFWQLQLQEGQEYKKTYKGNQVITDYMTFSDSLTFHWGSQTIQLIHMADNGQSTGDVIAWIPEKRIVAAGDIIVGPTPYAINLNVAGMPAAIQKILDLRPSIIIPGHGEVEYDTKFAELSKEAFVAYINEAERNMANNVPLKEAVKTPQVPILPEIEQKFAKGDDVILWAFRAFFSRRVIANMYRLKGK
jgi:cyclase